MTALVTGSNGFLGRNLVSYLHSRNDITVLEHHHTESEDVLRDKCKQADCVFHLAGVSRPKDISEFEAGNVLYLSNILHWLVEARNYCPVMMASSIQASMEPPYGVTEYGKSKRLAEALLFQHREMTGARVLIYRLPHLFGSYGRPGYNNVMHTFIHHIANGMPIRVDNASFQLQLLYATDFVKELVDAVSNPSLCGYCTIESPIYEKTLGEVVATLHRMISSKISSSDSFEVKLQQVLSYYQKNGSNI